MSSPPKVALGGYSSSPEDRSPGTPDRLEAMWVLIRSHSDLAAIDVPLGTA